MPTADPNVILRLGSHAEKDYFLKTIKLWDGLIVGANLLESASGATASLIVRFAGAKHQVPYYIDPMTYTFGTYVERGASEPRTDLDWIKSDQKNRQTGRPERRYKRSYVALANALGGPILEAFQNDQGISPLDLKPDEIDQLCDSTIQYQLSRVREEFAADPEYGTETESIPTPAALFAPYFFIAPTEVNAGLDLFHACAGAAASFDVNTPIHAVLCADVSSLGSQEFLSTAAKHIRTSGVAGVWLWFSRFYEEAAIAPTLLAFRRFVEELSDHVDVYNMHGSYLSLALSRFGLCGVSHGVGYGEQKDIIPVIGQSTPTVRYYLPDLKRRLGVPQIERALAGIGVKTADEFFENVCDCVICRGVIGPDLNNFSLFGDLHYSSWESKRKAQTPAAAKRCRFHFLLNRARERDELRTDDPAAIARRFGEEYEKWKGQPTVSADANHLLNWKRVFEE